MNMNDGKVLRPILGVACRVLVLGRVTQCHPGSLAIPHTVSPWRNMTVDLLVETGDCETGDWDGLWVSVDIKRILTYLWVRSAITCTRIALDRKHE